MNAHLVRTRTPCPRRCGCLVALLLLFGAPAVSAGPPPRLVAPASAPVVTASWWSPIENLLRDRRRMIQMVIVMMCIGLFVMWRKVE